MYNGINLNVTLKCFYFIMLSYFFNIFKNHQKYPTVHSGDLSVYCIYLFCSPSGKMILNTKKKITMDTPPVINVTNRL